MRAGAVLSSGIWGAGSPGEFPLRERQCTAEDSAAPKAHGGAVTALGTLVSLGWWQWWLCVVAHDTSRVRGSCLGQGGWGQPYRRPFPAPQGGRWGGHKS